MPLTMVHTGEAFHIKNVGGKEDTRRFLENLGFVAGGIVTVISEVSGNMIVNIKDSRVAIGKDMANKIKYHVNNYDTHSKGLILLWLYCDYSKTDEGIPVLYYYMLLQIMKTKNKEKENIKI